MRKTIITALLLTCCTAQAAPQWVSVGKTNNGKLEAFVDLGSVRVSGDIRRAWFKYVYAPRSQRDERANKWDKVSFGQEAFNCAEETSRIEALNVQYEDGTEWSEPPALLPSSWTLIGPRTLRGDCQKFCVLSPVDLTIDLEPIAEHHGKLRLCRTPFASRHLPLLGDLAQL